MWNRSGQTPDGPTVTCFFEDEPVNSNILELAEWENLKEQLYSWDFGVSDTMGCYDLSNAQRAVPNFQLTDDECPNIMLLDARRAKDTLRRDG